MPPCPCPPRFAPGSIPAGSVVWDRGKKELLNLPPLKPPLFPQREEAAAVLPRPAHGASPLHSVLLTLVALAGVAGLLVALAVALCVRQHARKRDKERLAALGPEGAHGDTTFEYQVCGPRSLLGRGDGSGLGSWVSHGMRVGNWVGGEPPSLGMFGGYWRSPSGGAVGRFEWVRIGSTWSLSSSQCCNFGGLEHHSVISEVVIGTTHTEQRQKGQGTRQETLLQRRWVSFKINPGSV